MKNAFNYWQRLLKEAFADLDNRTKVLRCDLPSDKLSQVNVFVEVVLRCVMCLLCLHFQCRLHYRLRCLSCSQFRVVFSAFCAFTSNVVFGAFLVISSNVVFSAVFGTFCVLSSVSSSVPFVSLVPCRLRCLSCPQFRVVFGGFRVLSSSFVFRALHSFRSLTLFSTLFT